MDHKNKKWVFCKYLPSPLFCDEFYSFSHTNSSVFLFIYLFVE
jgi:hypothetical protein